MTSSRQPRLSCHMMVKNAATVVRRALTSLAGIVDEVCAVDTGSSDDTIEVIYDLSTNLPFHAKRITVSPKTHPYLFFLDDPTAFEHTIPGPFSGTLMMADWSIPRNLGLNLCDGKYILKLDADDEVLTPGNILPTLDYLDLRPEIDVVMCPYEVVLDVSDSQFGSKWATYHHDTYHFRDVGFTSMYSRIWRNQTHIRFREAMHENIDWVRKMDGSNWLMAQEGLRVRDWRDSPGDGIRQPNRNFKVLLREHERFLRDGLPITMYHNLHLAEEGIAVMPELSLQVLAGITWPPLQSRLPSSKDEIVEVDRAWAATIRGEAYERLGKDHQAAEAYAEAASFNNRRAALLAALTKQRLSIPGWQDELSIQLSLCQRKLYPFGASNLEVIKARKILAQG
jgi:glycosyltransferase involved in cell wall biosynthesis